MEKKLLIIKNQHGVSAIILALSLVVLLGFAALAVDIGYLYSAKNELQNAADAAALAASRELGRIYSEETLSSTDFGATENSSFLASIYNVAVDVAGKNVAAGNLVSISEADIEIGQWNPTSRTLTETLIAPDAVRVVPKREASSDNAVTLFFARVLGIVESDVSATATAALSGLAEIDEGGLPIPVGISKYWFTYYKETGFCNRDIKFHPTNTLDGCAGWHTYTSKPATASKLGTPGKKGILDGLRTGSFTSPAATAGETKFEFIGGTLASAFGDMKALYDAKKDPVTGEWKTSVVVYDRNDCSNPNTAITIVGFAKTTVYKVEGPPGLTIFARIECDFYEPDTRGGGGNYGLKGAIPGLVQ
jgi:hypothetical protein